MTEAELQAAMLAKCAELDHWTLTIRHPAVCPRCHLRLPPAAPEGWVDVLAIGQSGALFIENKSAEGRRSRAQIRVASRIIAAGLEYRLWRPEDWPDRIIAELEAIR